MHTEQTELKTSIILLPYSSSSLASSSTIPQHHGPCIVLYLRYRSPPHKLRSSPQRAFCLSSFSCRGWRHNHHIRQNEVTWHGTDDGDTNHHQDERTPGGESQDRRKLWKRNRYYINLFCKWGREKGKFIAAVEKETSATSMRIVLKSALFHTSIHT